MPARSTRRSSDRGTAPDRSPVALLLIDFINDFEFEGGARIFPRALAAARAAARLKARAKRARIPVVYANDNFGKWRSDFRSMLEHCKRDDVRGRAIALLLEPDKDDYFVLKPRHSAFHSTTLDVLLDYLGTRTLILAGVAGNNCVMFTAHDAYLREFRLVVPADCVASPSEADDRYALAHMKKVLKADVRRSVRLRLGGMKQAR